MCASTGVLPSEGTSTNVPDMSPARVPFITSQPHHTDLQPPRTSHSTEYERRASVQSTICLPSPSAVAARAYYLHRGPPIGQKYDVQQRRRSLFEVQQIPRRHSAVAQSGDVAIRMASLNVSPLRQVVQPTSKPTPETAFAVTTRDTAVAIKVEKEEDATSTTLKESESVNFQKSSTTSQERRPRARVPLLVPFDFSHDHLQEWGYAYLGNSATADAFINAVSLRRSSFTLMKEEEVDENTSSNMVTIRARVLPKEKERKPLIRREVDVEELRRSIPLTQSAKEGHPVVLRRSSRDRRHSTQLCNISLRRGSAVAGMVTKSKLSAKSSVPIRE